MANENGKIQVEITGDQLAITIRALESYGALLQNRVASEAALPLHLRLPPEIAATLERQVDACRVVAERFEECRLDARLDAAFASDGSPKKSGVICYSAPLGAAAPKPRRRATKT